MVVEGEAKRDAKEVDKRRLEEQAQAKGIAADAGVKRVSVEGEARRKARRKRDEGWRSRLKARELHQM
jgi:hypothetical protein